jgi:hypothetical protein
MYAVVSSLYSYRAFRVAFGQLKRSAGRIWLQPLSGPRIDAQREPDEAQGTRAAALVTCRIDAPLREHRFLYWGDNTRNYSRETETLIEFRLVPPLRHRASNMKDASTNR